MRQRAGQLLQNNKLISNFFFLSVVQGISLIVPLVIVPYVVLKVGIGNFGLISFVQSIMFLLALLIDFGFNVSATRKISINRNDKAALETVYSNTLMAKTILLAGAFVLLIVLSFFSKFSSESFLYFSSFAIVVGQAYLPTWLYMGLEKMRDYVIINVAGKIIFLVTIFLFIKETHDYIWVNLLLGVSTILATIISLLHIRYKLKIQLHNPAFSMAVNELRTTIPIFFTSVAINVSSYSNSVILGLFAGYEVVGLFTIAEKVAVIVKQAPSTFSQVLYPAGCNAASQSFNVYRLLLKKSYKPFFLFFMVVCTIIFFSTEYIVLYFNHSPNVTLNLILKFFIVAVFTNSLNIPAYQTLLSFNFQKSYSITLVTCCVVSIFTNFLLTSLFGIWGTTINVLLAEIMIVISLYVILHYRHPNFSILNSRTYV